jgi:hypothetical protein
MFVERRPQKTIPVPLGAERSELPGIDRRKHCAPLERGVGLIAVTINIRPSGAWAGSQSNDWKAVAFAESGYFRTPPT